MELKVKDQIAVSSVQADSLRPGQTITVSESLGKELQAKHPTKFEAVSGGAAKAEPAPDNKAEGAAPANKAITGRKTKAE
jgi:hypothetical protein